MASSHSPILSAMSMASITDSTSFIHASEAQGPFGDRDDDIDSLPSSTTEASSNYSDAEREWNESLQQLELLLTMVLVPYVGKYFGRKCAYWGWKRFMEWKYPVEVVVTSSGLFKTAGAVEAAASL